MISLCILHKIFGGDTAKKKVIEAAVGLAVTVFLGAVVLIFCLLFVSPVQIYNKQKQTISELQSATNAEQKRLKDKANEDWKSSPKYQQQMEAKTALEIVARQCEEVADKYSKNPSDPTLTDVNRDVFFTETVPNAMKKSAIIGLDLTELIRVQAEAPQGMRTPFKMQEWYHNLSVQYQKLLRPASNEAEYKAGLKL